MQILTLNLIIFCFAFAASASQYYETFAFLPRDRASERANGIEPIIKINNNPVRLRNQPDTYYDFRKFDSGQGEIFQFSIESGPEGFGCFVGSQEQPYRSHFIKKNKPLEQIIPMANYFHCYALEFPNRDVLIDFINIEGLRGSIVLNTEQGYGSLPIPKHCSHIDSVAIVEEADPYLLCRVDMSDGNYLFMSAQDPELTNISDAKFIGCRIVEGNSNA